MTTTSNKMSTNYPWFGEFLSEFMGTFVVMIIGNSAMAAFLLKKEHDLFAVTFAWGMAVMMGMLIGARTSGGHVNPMVTVGMASISKMPWTKVPHYILGQLLGAFFSCPVLYVNNRELINNFDGGVRSILGANGTGILWTTFPDANVSIGTCVFDTILCSALIMFCILAIVDKDNGNVPAYLHCMYVALLVMTIVWVLGSNCMCAINPARDLAPRIFAALMGYNDVFGHRHFWWVPTFMPLVGGVVGCYTYVYTIGKHLPTKSVEQSDCNELEEMKKDVNKA